jgi:LacI family transcriptional regulator
MGKKAVTMKDIALRAQVTKATVSLALAGDERISAVTRQKVLKVARALHYAPHEAASRLARGKSDAIAFVAVRFAAPFVAAVLEGLEERAFSLGRYLRGIRPYSTFNQTAVKEEILKEILYARKAEAVILLSVAPSPTLAAEYKARGVPLVLIESDAVGAHSVRLDNKRGAFLATEALIKRGRKKIALFNGPTRPKAGEDADFQAQDRLEGYLAALRKHKIPPDKARIVSILHPHADEGAHAFEACVRKGQEFDAVFCAAGDAVAMGVMEAARFLKIRIPQDLSLIGFGDTPAAALLSPALSSVHQEFKELGSLAFDTAIEAIEGRLKTQRKIVIEPELVLRESA